MPEPTEVDRKLLGRQVKAFKARRQDYVEYAEFLRGVLDAVRAQIIPMTPSRQ